MKTSFIKIFHIAELLKIGLTILNLTLAWSNLFCFVSSHSSRKELPTPNPKKMKKGKLKSKKKEQNCPIQRKMRKLREWFCIKCTMSIPFHQFLSKFNQLNSEFWKEFKKWDWHGAFKTPERLQPRNLLWQVVAVWSATMSQLKNHFTEKQPAEGNS